MEQPATTPYEMLGGDAVVQAIVDRFYRLMDEEAAYSGLRALHADDLSGVKAGLNQFLSAWLGGPKTWFDRKICMMSLHRPMPITPDIAHQWCDAMARAIADQPGVDDKLSAAMSHRLMNMAMAMVNKGGVSGLMPDA